MSIEVAKKTGNAESILRLSYGVNFQRYLRNYQNKTFYNVIAIVIFDFSLNGISLHHELNSRNAAIT